MPNFPKLSGDLPEVLNPFNLRHYSLLAYWVYCRPTVFASYLYHAAPEVYQAKGLSKFLKTWRIPAYRNIYFMLPLALAFTLLWVGLAILLYKTITVQHNIGWVNRIAIAPNGQIAITASGDRALKVNVPAADSTLRVWDLRWGGHLHTLEGHQHSVTDVAITPDGKKAVSSSRDRTLKVWDIQQGVQLQHLGDHEDWVSSVALTPDGQRAISASGDKTLKIWDINTGKALNTLKGHTAPVLSVVVTPDGQRAISAGDDRTLKVWDITQARELYTLKGHTGGVTKIALAPNGQQVISASLDSTLKVWDIQQGRELYTLVGHKNSVTDVAVTPDGKQVVSASADRTLKIWDLAQGTLLNTLEGHKGWVTSLAITPDSQQVVSASSDHTVKVWDLRQAKALHTLKAHQTWVTAIAVLPNSPRLISGSFEGIPKLWSLQRGTQQPMLGFIGKIISLNLSFAVSLTLAVMLVAISIALLLASGLIAFGIAGDIAASTLIGFAGSMAFCLAFLMAERIAADPVLEEVYGAKNISIGLTVIFGIVLGFLVGIAFALSSRKAVAPFASVIFILVIGIIVGLIVACVVTESLSFKGRLLPGIRTVIAVSITFNWVVACGALRLPLYPVQFFMALFGRLRDQSHPVLWDELLVLPVPKTQALLRAHLRTSEREGLRRLVDVARNPFQRVWAQRTLQSHFHNVPAPLHFLYYLLTDQEFNTYLAAPVSQLDWQLLPTTRQLLLGELAHQRVDFSSSGLNQVAENCVWALTWIFRRRKQTPLTRLANLLYQLTYSKRVEDKNFLLKTDENIYANLSQYPGGMEIANSFEAMGKFLNYAQLSDLAMAKNAVLRLSVDEVSIRPTVLTTLLRLGEMAVQVRAYESASTSIEQLATLAQMTSTLGQLDKYVLEQVIVPEQAILRRIIRQWQGLVSQAVVNIDLD
jgi:WD40 repeat protein